MIIIHENKVEQQCCICGQKSQIKLSESEIEAYRGYLKGGKLIQECLPTLNKCEREFLKSGYCMGCQELLFGNGNTEKVYTV